MASSAVRAPPSAGVTDGQRIRAARLSAGLMAKLMGSGLCEKGIVWWRDYRASRKVRSGFGNKMRVEATGIPKSAKRFSEQDARGGNRHPEKCEAVFGTW